MHARWIGRERPKVLPFQWEREAHGRIGNKYKVEYIVIYEYVGQIGYNVRYHIIVSF